MKDQVQLLIETLEGSTGRQDEREEAAGFLSEYEDERVLKALIRVASDPDEDDVLAHICAESIGELCTNMNWFDQTEFRKMTPFAQKIAFGMIMLGNPKLIGEPFKTEFLNVNFR